MLIRYHAKIDKTYCWCRILNKNYNIGVLSTNYYTPCLHFLSIHLEFLQQWPFSACGEFTASWYSGLQSCSGRRQGLHIPPAQPISFTARYIELIWNGKCPDAGQQIRSPPQLLPWNAHGRQISLWQILPLQHCVLLLQGFSSLWQGSQMLNRQPLFISQQCSFLVHVPFVGEQDCRLKLLCWMSFSSIELPPINWHDQCNTIVRTTKITLKLPIPN